MKTTNIMKIYEQVHKSSKYPVIKIKGKLMHLATCENCGEAFGISDNYFMHNYPILNTINKLNFKCCKNPNYNWINIKGLL